VVTTDAREWKRPKRSFGQERQAQTNTRAAPGRVATGGGLSQGRSTQPLIGPSLFQMGEYFEILAAPVDPGRIRKRSRKRWR
jgi:hypothetical protein